MNRDAIFIVGAPRSGTTLLQSMLSAHSRLFTAPETSFFSGILPGLGIRFNDPDCVVTRDALQFIRQDIQRMTGSAIPESYVEQSADGETIRDAFERLLQLFNTDNKPLWVEKTTIHARHMIAIRRFYPDARFIHIIRDPVASVGSMLNISPTSFGDLRINYIKSIRGYAGFWNECVSDPLLYPDQENVLHLQYEDLVNNAELSLRKVMAFLEIEFEPACLQDFHKSAETIVSAESCPWQKANLAPDIDKSAIDKWRRRMSSEKIWLIQKHTQLLSQYLGYFDSALPVNYIKLFFVYIFDNLKWFISKSKMERIIRRIF